MGISFGKRKLKIKIIEQKEQAEENQPVKIPVPKQNTTTIDKSVLKINRSFKGMLGEMEKRCKTEWNLSDFTAYQYFFSDGRYQFKKITGGINLNGIILEKYLSIAKPTVFRRAAGLTETTEYRSRLIVLYGFDNKDYIFMWSSILYEAFDEELIKQLQTLLTEMRE